MLQSSAKTVVIIIPQPVVCNMSNRFEAEATVMIGNNQERDENGQKVIGSNLVTAKDSQSLAHVRDVELIFSMRIN